MKEIRVQQEDQLEGWFRERHSRELVGSSEDLDFESTFPLFQKSG